MYRCNWYSSSSEMALDMRKQIIFEVKTSWSPEPDIQPGHLAIVVPALHRLHPPAGAVVALPLSLHEHLHIPHHVSVSLVDAGSHQLKLFQGKLQKNLNTNNLKEFI